MEKINVQEKQIHSITHVVEGFTTHFSNIGDRQTKIEKQMTVQNNSLQHLTRTIETLSHYIIGKSTYPSHPPITDTPPYTPTKTQFIIQLTSNSREPIPTSVGGGKLL